MANSSDLLLNRTPPRNPYEQTVHSIWAEVLGVSDFGVHDDFFALGGHSMLAPRIVSRIRRTLDVQIPVRDFFGCRTVATLAAVVATASANAPERIARRSDDAPPLLSFDEQRLWLESQLLPDIAYNVHGRRRLRGPLDRAVFEASLRHLLLRHETLRTRYPLRDSRPVPVVDELDPRWKLPLTTLDGPDSADAEDRLAAALNLADEQMQTPFNLADGPLFRCMLIRLAENDHVLAITAHHIVCDDWSVGLFTRELAALYAAAGDPERAGLAPLSIRYRDYAGWQHEHLEADNFAPALDYWRHQLAGVSPPLTLPAAWRHIEVRRQGATTSGRLTRNETSDIGQLCRTHGTTSFMVCCAALAAMLGRWSGQDDLVVGVPIAGRTDAGTESLVGFLINMLPIRIDLSGDPTFAELLARTRQVCLEGYANAATPLDVLVERLSVVRDPRRPPLFEVMLNVMNHTGGDGEDLAGLSSETLVPGPALPTKFDLSLNLTESDHQLQLELHVNPDRYPADLSQAFLDQLLALLRCAIAEPDRTVASIPTSSAVDTTQAIDLAPSSPMSSVSADRIAIESATGSCRYDELVRMVSATAAGLNRGGRLAIVRRSSVPFVAAVLACARAEVTSTVVEDVAPAALAYLGVTETLDPTDKPPRACTSADRTDPDPLTPEAIGELLDGGQAARRWQLCAADRIAVASTRPGSLLCGVAAGMAAGATVVLPDDGVDLNTWLSSTSATVVILSVAQLRAVRIPLPGVHRIIVEHDPDLIDADVRAARRVAPNAWFTSVYRPDHHGRPRMSHDVASHEDLTQLPLRVPIGRAWAGVTYSLPATPTRPAAIGEVAELCIGSHHTGDRVRMWPNGILEQVGRIGDSPGADPVEATAELRDLPDVSDAVVVRTLDKEGQEVLIGYVAGPQPSEDAVPLRQSLGIRLPDHLIPRQICVLEALPRTTAGEYDLDALPLVDVNDSEDYVAPRTPFEAELCNIFVELLGVERISVHDTFFELNGFSLLATQLTARIRDTFAVDLPLRDVFTTPTVAGLAELILRIRAERTAEADLDALLRDVESLP